MFAVLAMAGDVGCTIGPGWVGLISGRVAAGALPLAQTLFGAENLTQTGLRAGLLAAVVFPALLLVCVLRLKAKKRG